MSLSVIIAETNNERAQELKSSLESDSYITDIVFNGKDLQKKVYECKYIGAILDMETKNHSALEVLRYMRLNSPSTKVILTFSSQEKFKEMDFDEKELRKMGASDILVYPFKNASILESIAGKSQFESLKKIKTLPHSKEEEVTQVNDNEFTHIKIEDFLSGNASIFDCYFKLSPNKYMKVLHQGDFLDPERLQKYLAENITHLYFKTKDRTSYINFINTILAKKISSPNIAVEEKVSLTRSVSQKFMEEVYDQGVNPTLAAEGEKVCNNIYSLIKGDSKLAKLMGEYQEYDQSAYSHLFLVSFFSAITCEKLEWSSQRTVELVTFGAFFHDIGMLRLLEQEIKLVEETEQKEIKVLKRKTVDGRSKI